MGRHMEELKELLCEELDKIAAKGELTAGSLDTVDKLTHSIKSIDTIMAMDDYSQQENGNSYTGNYMRGNSYARRDGRDRYSRIGREGGNSNRRYSRDDDKEQVIEHLEELMEETNDNEIKHAIKKAIHQLEA